MAAITRDLVVRGCVTRAGIYATPIYTRAQLMNKQTTLTPRGEQFYAVTVAGLFVAAAWVTLQLFARVVIFTAQFLGIN